MYNNSVLSTYDRTNVFSTSSIEYTDDTNSPYYIFNTMTTGTDTPMETQNNQQRVLSNTEHIYSQSCQQHQDETIQTAQQQSINYNLEWTDNHSNLPVELHYQTLDRSNSAFQVLDEQGVLVKESNVTFYNPNSHYDQSSANLRLNQSNHSNHK